MKVETPTYIFTTPPDSQGAALNILQKPAKGAPYISINIQAQTDVEALNTVLNPPKQ